MKMLFPLFLTAIIFAAGCTVQNDIKPLQTTRPDISTTTTLPITTIGPTTTEAIDNYPTISTSLNPSNPSAGQLFNLTISASDDRGLTRLSWQSSKPFSNLGQSSYSCNVQTTCSNTWQLNASEQGTYQITAVAVDSRGKNAEANLQVTVGPPRIVSTTTSSTTTTTVPTTTTSGCSSNSDCGRKQICQNKKCVDVECTTDSQCSGCKRCSNYDCVSCGSGPYGCYC